MNERFNFRVWDDTHKEYLPLSDCKLEARTGKLVKQSLFQENRYIIEQCTGLKDKNGKLIYEGDVFEATVLNSFDGDEIIGKRIRGQVAYYVDEAAFTFAAYSPFNLSELEIIGNIHEKELAK